MSNKRGTQTIYIRMLEGVETFIPVEAKHIIGNTFEIISVEDLNLDKDATCIYEFFPRDIVICEVRKDIFFPVQERNVTFLLATELVKSDFPNRKLHQLIFLIVKNLGELKPNELQEFNNEIVLLCSEKGILHRQHPIIKRWLTKNCK